MAVPKMPPSYDSTIGELYRPLLFVVLSLLVLYVGVSDKAGTADTSGGASEGPEEPAIFGRNLSTEALTMVVEDWPDAALSYVLFCSPARALVDEATLLDADAAAATAEDRGDANEFLTFENSELTSVYDD